MEFPLKCEYDVKIQERQIPVTKMPAFLHKCCLSFRSHRIHVWYIYLHLPQKSTSTIHAGQYTNPIHPMGMYQLFSAETFNFDRAVSTVISIPCPGDIPIRRFIIVTFPKDTRCLFFWCDLCRISNFKHLFVSSFSLSPRSQELLVSDLWFTVSQF